MSKASTYTPVRCILIALPPDYLKYVEDDGPMFGSMFELEPLEDIKQLNEDIEISNLAPGFIAFGGDGGGEIFAFNSSGEVFLLPLVGLASDSARQVASSWTEYIEKLIPNT